MKVFFWTNGKDDPYYRMKLPARALKDKGYEVMVGPINEKALEADIVIAQFDNTPQFNAWVYFMMKGGLPVIIDVDSRYEQSAATERAYGVIYSEMDRNPAARKTFYIPSFIDEQYLSFNPRRKEQVTIGWAGDDPEDVQVIKSCINRMVKDHNISWRTVGLNESLGVDNHKHTYRPSDRDEYMKALNFDIAVHPLANKPENERVTRVRALEYAAAGIPVVASRKGAFETYIKHGVNGYLAKNARDWVRYVERLVLNEDTRHELGQQARDMAAKRTIQANVNFYEEVIIPHARSGGPKQAKAIMDTIRRGKELVA